MDEFVSDRLQLSHMSHTSGSRNQKRMVMTHQDMIENNAITEDDGETLTPLTVDKLELNVAIRNGDEVDEDCACDSEFMSNVMPEVGRRLRECHRWVPEDEPTCLGMDNAGGHGTDDAKKKHTQMR